MPTIAEYITKLPVEEKKIAGRLHEIICSMMPEVVEKFTFGVPHYFGSSRICFLWPSSVSGGTIKEGLAFGFCQGYLMANEEGILKRLGKTNISMIRYTSVNDIDESVLCELLAEAIMLDERVSMAGHLKKGNTKNKK
ncbi:MAG: DUF1801 domain-containing protein [Ignavibacteria bacterium]